jgi:Lrp/AsnC family leucine-responsive transcriptional regulator
MTEAIQMDRIDRRIVAALARDARISMAALGKAVGLSKSPTLARVRRLERDGVITGYRADLDHEKLGQPHIAFVQVTLDTTTTRALDAFNAAVMAHAEIETAHMIAGGFDYLLRVRSTDIAAYRRILGEVIAALPHVAQTTTFVAIETVKEG